MLDFTATVASVRTSLSYGKDIAEVHADLVAAGWGAEEAHFIIRAAQILG